MGALELLEDVAARPRDVAGEVLDGLAPEVLNAMPHGTQNSIAWLVWHAARQQDVQIAQLGDAPQVWSEQGWDAKFGLDRPEDAFGLGDTPQDVARVRVTDPQLLRDYLAATVAATVDYLRGLSEADLDEVIDRSWDPPVTRGVRIVSTLDDAAQHLGQAAYVRGLLDEHWSSAH